ncbi:hypothetical protein [Acinetobacter pittii]|uniref:Uncharacterized protein n=1 Tax=Acinetobacter pittii TaxID=48296 RepID=A0A3R9REF2_ACIPI|nr:hypothetical protein [Acinetobacter pittii]HEM6651489.1 hypothetical protein [Acinetobacter baumannii]KQE11484.1 hypothetical protein APD36_17445 [Acinetobacter pittii]KRI47706.1 hypothetical protein APC42_10150 [Acinetobacter pittii]RSO51573.1 hypothetical protein EA758_14810 [Acinetobacter pittii]RSO57841.1 hypothetical protein EA752_14565 [Acinetobacter pittii]
MSERIFYTLPRECSKSRYELNLNDKQAWLESDLDFVSNQCAQDYWDNHDGWESTWPLEISIFETETAEAPIATYIVDMEMEPSFSSSVKAESKEH